MLPRPEGAKSNASGQGRERRTSGDLGPLSVGPQAPATGQARGAAGKLTQTCATSGRSRTIRQFCATASPCWTSRCNYVSTFAADSEDGTRAAYCDGHGREKNSPWPVQRNQPRTSSPLGKLTGQRLPDFSIARGRGEYEPIYRLIHSVTLAIFSGTCDLRQVMRTKSKVIRLCDQRGTVVFGLEIRPQRPCAVGESE